MKPVYEIRCSKLARPMVCAGSLRHDVPEQEAGDPAKEGTACGELLACLVTGRTPPSHASNGVRFDEDMYFYAKPIADLIKSRAQTEVLCETRIDWSTRSGIKIRGSYDISYVKDGKLHIEDLKYGWKIVDVKENWQLIGYAIGEVIRRGIAFDRIVFKIHQPRPHHEDGPERTWEITYEQLLAYKERIEKRMEQIANGLTELVTSDQCKYCPSAASACTAINRAMYHGIDIVLSDFKQDNLTEAEISMQLSLLSRVTDILKIKTDSINQLAVDRIKAGAVIPGYMTEESYGDRSWKPSVSPDAIKVLTGIDIIEKSMLSPAKAEKIGVPKDLVKSLVTRRFVGNKLVRKDSAKLADKIFGTTQPEVKK